MRRLLVALLLLATRASAAPCDALAASGTPCVAAHSTVRTLIASFAGALYQLKRSFDGKTLDILAHDGVADAEAQDAFCAGSACLIQRIYDQSGLRNHLDVAPAGGAHAAPDRAANATAAAVTVGGHRAYGVYSEHGTGPGKQHSGTGYRIDNTSGVARGDEPESIFMVVDGRHFNSGCCYDYGNAELSNHDEGKGTMEAVYFGSFNASRSGWSGGSSRGPWVMADLCACRDDRSCDARAVAHAVCPPLPLHRTRAACHPPLSLARAVAAEGGVACARFALGQ